MSASLALVPLPRREYYRASKLGEGSYGSVVTVFDEDGNSFAAKVFEEDSDDADSDSDDSEAEWTPKSDSSIEVGVLRELSMLRFLNGGHPHIMRIVDITIMENSLCMIMPKAAGCLGDAITKQTLSGALKLRVAIHLLDAVDFLASHGVMHRDIKPDNILLDDLSVPTLTDFSLAKATETDSATTSAKHAAAAKKDQPRKRDRKDRGAAAGGLHTAGQASCHVNQSQTVNISRAHQHTHTGSGSKRGSGSFIRGWLT